MEASFASETQSDDLIYQFGAPVEWGRPRRAPCFAARMSRLYSSRDEGKTWQSAYRTLNLSQDLPTLAVAVAPCVAGGLVVFVGYNGVFYSSDGGGHWQTGNLGLIDVNVLCLGISPGFEADQTVFAGTRSGLFCSRNAGRAWREVELSIGYEAVISLALSPNFGIDGTLFAGTETQGLLGSEDAGRGWRRVGQPALSNSINQIVLGPDYPRQPQLLVLHDGGLSTSHDGGATWQPWPAPALNAEAATAVLAPRGFGAGAPVLVGLESGRAIRFRG